MSIYAQMNAATYPPSEKEHSNSATVMYLNWKKIPPATLHAPHNVKW